ELVLPQNGLDEEALIAPETGREPHPASAASDPLDLVSSESLEMSDALDKTIAWSPEPEAPEEELPEIDLAPLGEAEEELSFEAPEDEPEEHDDFTLQEQDTEVEESAAIPFDPLSADEPAEVEALNLGGLDEEPAEATAVDEPALAAADEDL